MLIMGVDPGTVITGYGLVKRVGGSCQALDFGAIRPSPKAPLTERYAAIFEAIETLLHRFHPNAVAVETQFVAKNPQSALKLGMAKGVVLLAATRQKIPVFEYTPSRAKQAVTGTGKASKHQVGEMITRLLGLPSVPEPEDVADALSLAICHAYACDREHLLGVRL
jgi:crossover junction endodeoxyribonuclease RuvC